jgi:hypothetical protein
MQPTSMPDGQRRGALNSVKICKKVTSPVALSEMLKVSEVRWSPAETHFPERPRKANVPNPKLCGGRRFALTHSGPLTCA